MDLNKTLKDLEAQHAAKLQQIAQIEQALNKAQTERIKIEGAYEIATKLLEEDKKVEVEGETQETKD